MTESYRPIVGEGKVSYIDINYITFEQLMSQDWCILVLN